MYKLYTRAGSGGFAAEAALSMAGVPFTKVEVKRGPPDEAFLGISPLGQVPVLTLPDGSSVTESAAICILIAELYPEAVLSPAPGSPGRAHFLRWMLFMSSVLYPALLRFFYAERYSASADGVAEVKRYALAESDRAFVILDAALEDRDWLVGDRSFDRRRLFVDARLLASGRRPSARGMDESHSPCIGSQGGACAGFPERQPSHVVNAQIGFS